MKSINNFILSMILGIIPDMGVRVVVATSMLCSIFLRISSNFRA